jgi:hypothetical protein
LHYPNKILLLFKHDKCILHPGLPGIVLNMRHSGYGWLGFLKPHKDAFAAAQRQIEEAVREMRD